jgi:uncharacterized Zn-binding protein involved in type VI secretion
MPGSLRTTDKISCGDVTGKGSNNVYINNRSSFRAFRDLTAGHCFTPTRITSGSPNVFVNNSQMARIGDSIFTHCCGSTCHSGVASTGSNDVFANEPGSPPSGRPPAREVILQQIDNFKQPTASRTVAADTFVDDDEAPDIGPSDPRYVAYKSVVDREINVERTQEITNTVVYPPSIPNQTVFADCSDIIEREGTFPLSFPLSPNYTLENLLNCRVSKYPLRPNAGLTEKQIVCNLRAVCLNILEPLLQEYDTNMVINSGFRIGTGTSQHLKGQAVDIAFPSIETNADKMFERATEITSKIAYDQFIYELGITTFWIHLSFNQSQSTILPANKVLTKPRLPVNGHQYLKGIVYVK